MGREDDVVGGEILALVEFDALAQMKAPMQRVDEPPSSRQAGLELHVGSAPDQPFIDGRVDAQAEAFVDLIGVDRFELALEGEAQDFGLGREGEARRKDRGESDRGEERQVQPRQFHEASPPVPRLRAPAAMASLELKQNRSQRSRLRRPLRDQRFESVPGGDPAERRRTPLHAPEKAADPRRSLPKHRREAKSALARATSPE